MSEPSAATATPNAGVVPSSTGVITLNILTADAGGTPTWSTVTFDGSTAGPFGLWQNWNINYDSTNNSYLAVPFSSPVGQPAGSMLINQFPVAGGTNNVSWYQIGVSDKIFNLYTTTNSGEFENPNYAGQLGNGVLIGPVQSISGMTFDQIFLVGLNEGTFPPPPPVDPLVTPWFRGRGRPDPRNDDAWPVN